MPIGGAGYTSLLLPCAVVGAAAATAGFCYLALPRSQSEEPQQPQAGAEEVASEQPIISAASTSTTHTMVPVPAEERWAELAAKQERLLTRLAALELGLPDSRDQALKDRQLEILERLAALEVQLGMEGLSVKAQPCSVGSTQPAGEGVSPVQARLTGIMLRDGLSSFKFIRAPRGYYDQPLEYRMGILGAASIHHLCKSIVMQNTRAPEDVRQDCSDPNYSKYYMVFVQYTAKLHAEKLHSFIRTLAAKSGHTLSKKQVNMRLVPEDVNTELTGFTHNAVAPVGCAVKIPMIVSHKIASLDPEFFWLGGGEVDLKLGFNWSDFNAVYQPFVVDCTYD